MARSTRRRRGRPMTVEFDGTFAAKFGDGLQEGHQSLHRTSLEDVTMIRPGAGVASSRGRKKV